MLIQNDKILSADSAVAETLNTFFQCSKNLGIVENSYILSGTADLTDPVDIALESMNLILVLWKQKGRVIGDPFSFNTVTLRYVEHEIRILNPNKATACCDSIPSRNLKDSYDICGPILHPIINNALDDCIFPDKLKLADIEPLHKGEDKTDKKFLTHKYATSSI